MRDFDRRLDEPGRDEAVRLAATMSVNGFQPDLVHCSTASRCRETLDILLAHTQRTPAIEHSEALYAAGHEAYLDLIAASDHPTTRSLMIVGHNPMIEDTAHALLQDDPDAYHRALGSGFPTAGLLIVDCHGRGSTAIKGDARFVALLSPVDA